MCSEILGDRDFSEAEVIKAPQNSRKSQTFGHSIEGISKIKDILGESKANSQRFFERESLRGNILISVL